MTGVQTCALPISSIEERDRKDSARADGPLVEANGAVVVDTTGRTVAEILDEINTLLEARR